MCLLAVNVNARCFDYSKDDDCSECCSVNEAYGVVKYSSNINQQLDLSTYYLGYRHALIVETYFNGNYLENDFLELMNCSMSSLELHFDMVFDKYKLGKINADNIFALEFRKVFYERLQNCKKKIKHTITLQSPENTGLVWALL